MRRQTVGFSSSLCSPLLWTNVHGHLYRRAISIQSFLLQEWWKVFAASDGSKTAVRRNKELFVFMMYVCYCSHSLPSLLTRPQPTGTRAVNVQRDGKALIVLMWKARTTKRTRAIRLPFPWWESDLPCVFSALPFSSIIVANAIEQTDVCCCSLPKAMYPPWQLIELANLFVTCFLALVFFSLETLDFVSVVHLHVLFTLSHANTEKGKDLARRHSLP